MRMSARAALLTRSSLIAHPAHLPCLTSASPSKPIYTIAARCLCRSASAILASRRAIRQSLLSPIRVEAAKMQAHGFSSNPPPAEADLELKLTNNLSESRSPYVNSSCSFLATSSSIAVLILSRFAAT